MRLYEVVFLYVLLIRLTYVHTEKLIKGNNYKHCDEPCTASAETQQ